MIQDFNKYLTLSVRAALKLTRLYVCVLAAILISLFFIQQTLAEDAESSKAEEPRWFEVEVILYKANSEVGLTDESWASDTEFSLPENVIDFLQPFSQPESAETDDELSSNSLQTSSPINDTLENANIAPTIKNSDGIQFANEKDITEQLDQIELELALEKPFVLLAEADFQLQMEAQRVSRNSRYTLLSHFSWRQPVLGRRDSQPVRIAGGTDFQELFDYAGTEKIEYIEDTISEQNQQNANESIQDITDENIKAGTKTDKNTNDKNALILINEQEFVPIALPWVPEIDGSMRVYIQRNYLHIDTTLFYRRPDKEEVNALDLTKSMLLSNGNYFPLSDTPQDVFFESTAIEAPTLTGFNSTQKDNSTLSAIGTNDIPETQSNANNFVTGQDQSSTFGFKFDEEFLHRKSEKMYITRLFNYPLKQTRRLRSGELHYFDHPLIGMLVMIRPYERFIENEFDDLDSDIIDAEIITAETISTKTKLKLKMN